MLSSPTSSESPLLSALVALADPPPPPSSRWYCADPSCDGLPHDGWTWRHARANQRPPAGDWLVWLIQAGRGYGKTRSGAEYTIDRVRTDCHRWALVGRSAGDVREVMIEGESGILACSPPDFRPEYQPSKRRITWPNGAVASTYSAEEAAQLRGPEHDGAWCDETSSWADAHKGDRIDTAWNNLMLGLRLGAAPRCVVTTTPKPNKLTREIAAKPTTVVTRGSTYDNLANLAPAFREQVLAAYEGTRIGRQELDGQLLEDIEGALWTQSVIDQGRIVLLED